MILGDRSHPDCGNGTYLIVLFEMLGIASIQPHLVPYSNKVIYLFLGGFILHEGRWDVHKRIALNVLRMAGGHGRSLVGGLVGRQCVDQHVAFARNTSG